MLILCHNYFAVSQNNKNDNEDNQHFSKKKFVFGLFILLLVDVLWVVSSELTKYIYVEQKIDRPFLVSYIRSSMLFVYLVVLCFSPPTRDPCRPSDYTQLLEPSADTDEDNFFTESNNSLGDSTFVPVRAGETTDSDDAAPRAVRFNKVAEVRVMSAAQAGEALLARLSWAASVRASEAAQRRAAAAATRRHLRLAVLLAGPWFAANYLYRLSLRGARTGPATLLVSAAGALALAGVAAARAGDRAAPSRLAGVALTAAGVVVLGVTERGGGDWGSAVAALGAATAYAAHLLLFRHELRAPTGVNAPLLVGLVGCVCGGACWLLGGALAAAGLERAAPPPPRAWGWLLLDAALGPLLLESLWLWSGPVADVGAGGHAVAERRRGAGGRVGGARGSRGRRGRRTARRRRLGAGRRARAPRAHHQIDKKHPEPRRAVGSADFLGGADIAALSAREDSCLVGLTGLVSSATQLRRQSSHHTVRNAVLKHSRIYCNVTSVDVHIYAGRTTANTEPRVVLGFVACLKHSSLSLPHTG